MTEPKTEPIEVVELCANCMTETIITDWDGNFHQTCKECGARLMLCDECTYRHDHEGEPACDWNSETDRCFRMEEGIMTNRNYPTRMHELIKALPWERFRIKGYDGEYLLNEEGDWRVIGLDQQTTDEVNPYAIVEAINHPASVYRKPRLTEEQKVKLKAMYDFGMRWLFYSVPGAKKSWLYATEVCPHYMSTDLGYMWKGERFQIKGSTLNELVSRESCESLDIVQTLRDAGVELPECLDT